MRFSKSTFVVLGLALAVTAFTVPAMGKKRGSANNADATATITEMENASVKADRAGDSSFVEKNYADNFSGGSSWGNWETKQSILADMKDSKNNRTNSEEISDLNVRLYGDTAIATYKSTYDSIYHGEHRARTILSTDTFAWQNGSWKQVASHSSELAK
ncbi:MAG TPA: nuclear transport factor 2 family protein [Candidatus Bathyarchaeia archaeon]|nr:nuclear transport factor 2 family protein [Candidatus Bathyarchaeia archaeon]